jgi:hypothetical protein
VQQLRASCLLRCFAPTTRYYCACALIARASLFVMAVDVSSSFCGSAAPPRYCSDMQQRSALSLLLCSAPTTRCRGACAVTARAPLVFINCRYQPRRLFQPTLSAVSTALMCSVRRASDLLLCSAPATRGCGACAVTADPSYISAGLIGCFALTCSSFARRISVDAWRPLLAVAVRLHSLHMHLMS